MHGHLLCWLRKWWLLAAWLLPTACQPAAPVGSRPVAGATPQQFFRYLQAGDSVYAKKAGLQSFALAQVYYDSAQVLADRTHDTLLLAEAVFARGRVYDAWNREPEKTIDYFEQAASLFARLPTQRRRYYYARYLVAHAYDKVPDSLRTVQVLRQLYRELAGQPAAMLRQVPSTVEMAVAAAEVRNYALADSLLRYLTRRAWIRNDPTTYDYLTHYYLVQSRLDIYYRHPPVSTYLDSLRGFVMHIPNDLDRHYYDSNLSELFAAVGQYQLAYAYLRKADRISDSLSNHGDLNKLRQTLLESERRAASRQQEYEQAARSTRTRVLVVLCLVLGLISLLSYYLYRQGHTSRERAQRLAILNQQLDEKVGQVELLNKEIQHRVKNNLHMVYSLLQMQERRTDNEEVIAHLQAARLRVESIAALHNQLLTRPEAGPDLAVYLRQLISSVISCLANDRQVVTHLQTEPLRLPASAYLALSLLLNEWVTNSVKYARPPDHTLEISVTVHHEATQACVRYADNGRLPAPGSPPAEPGLGTRIITLLTRQLRAKLHTPPDQPYHYELCIPYEPDDYGPTAENHPAHRGG